MLFTRELNNTPGQVSHNANPRLFNRSIDLWMRSCNKGQINSLRHQSFKMTTFDRIFCLECLGEGWGWSLKKWWQDADFLTRSISKWCGWWWRLPSILFSPASPIVAQTFWFAQPRTQWIFLKPIAVFKRKPISLCFPVKHKVHCTWTRFTQRKDWWWSRLRFWTQNQQRPSELSPVWVYFLPKIRCQGRLNPDVQVP